jgi:hypothetical protein
VPFKHHSRFASDYSDGLLGEIVWAVPAHH